MQGVPFPILHYGGSMTPLKEATPQDHARITSMWENGETVNTIAKALGWNWSTVRRYFDRNGIDYEPRPPGGERSVRWKGGRRQGTAGYVYVTLPVGHPWRSEYRPTMLEHRFIMSQALGRLLESWETVHHINGDRSDNRLENLQLRIKAHGEGQALRCRVCGSHDVEAVEL